MMRNLERWVWMKKRCLLPNIRSQIHSSHTLCLFRRSRVNFDQQLEFFLVFCVNRSYFYAYQVCPFQKKKIKWLLFYYLKFDHKITGLSITWYRCFMRMFCSSMGISAKVGQMDIYSRQPLVGILIQIFLVLNIYKLNEIWILWGNFV